MMPTSNLLPSAPATGAVPVPVTWPSLPSAEMAPQAGPAWPAGSLAFAECLGICSSGDAGVSAAEPVAVTTDSPEVASGQDLPAGQESEYPFYWTPIPQFAPPLPPALPPSFPNVSAAVEEKVVPADGEGALCPSSGQSGQDQSAGGPLPAPGATGLRQAPAAATPREDTASSTSLPEAKSFEASAAKSTIAGGRLPVPAQGGALTIASAALQPEAAGREDIATRGNARPMTEEKLQVEENKNTGKTTLNKVFKDLGVKSGIVSAYEVGSMSSLSANTLPVESPVAPVSAAPVAGELASAAVRMVERVAEVAELVRDTPAERVTLQLDLDETHRVEVRVLMREGRVHAEFRSDSPEVRTALSSAWADFTAKREAGAPVWAEPVFASLEAAAALPVSQAMARPAVVAPEAGLSGFGRDQATGQDASRRQPRQKVEPRGLPAAVSALPAATNPVLNQSTPVRDRQRLLSARA